MDARIRALAWEEFRVSGAIAAATLASGLLFLLSFRWNFGSGYPNSDTIQTMLAPMAVAFLLILSPDFSGSLAGGYSRRILQLPIPTSMTVAVTLFIRTLLVASVATVSVLTAHGLFDGNTLRFEPVLVITLLYLFAQLADWLRAPISGLSSLLVLLLIGTPVYLLMNDGADVENMMSFLSKSELLSSWLSILIVVGVFVATYCVAVPVVHLARTGRQTGIPEIWDWPKRFTFIPTLRAKPFSSPVAAQVWFEFRRSGWVVPVGTLLIFASAAGALWLRVGDFGTEASKSRIYLSLIPFGGVLLAAAAHATMMNLTQFRKPTGNPGYAFLQPLTDAQLASSRMIVNALCFFPTLLFVTILQFALVGSGYVTEAVPHALELGVASYREVVWTLIARGTLVALLGWVLMAISTRLLLAATLISVSTFVLITLTFQAFSNWDDIRFSLLPALLLFIVLVVVAYARAWRQGIVPLRAILVWGFAWALATWLLYGNARQSIEALAPNTLWHAVGFVSCVGFATLVPLPYIAVLFDVRWRRHGGKPEQTPSQHVDHLPWLWGTPRRAAASCAAACMATAILWVGWPARPAYEAVWKSKGRPVNLAELDAWYAAVSPEENRALRYMAVADKRRKVEFEFRYTLPERLNVHPDSEELTFYREDLLIFGKAEVKRGEAIPESTWKNTEVYWEAVTSSIAPTLKTLSLQDTGGSRYPVELQRGYQVNLGHLSRVRNLARELHLDALHWAVAGDSERAAESIVAIIPIANSLADEPTLTSQLTRIAVLTIALDALEDAMSRASFADADLERIHGTFKKAFPSKSEGLMLDHGMVGESVFSLSVILDMGVLPDVRHEKNLPGVPLVRLVLPTVAEQIIIASFHEDMYELSRLPWSELNRGRILDSDEYLTRSVFLAPLSAILLPVLGRAYESEWRLRARHELALTALAVERFQLAEGRLPKSLTDLVPVFITEVPVDYFSETGESLRYRRAEGGQYVVYSVGPDMEDDHGEEFEKKWEQFREGDITFTVDPALRQAHTRN